MPLLTDSVPAGRPLYGADITSLMRRINSLESRVKYSSTYQLVAQSGVYSFPGGSPGTNVLRLLPYGDNLLLIRHRANAINFWLLDTDLNEIGRYPTALPTGTVNRTSWSITNGGRIFLGLEYPYLASPTVTVSGVTHSWFSRCRVYELDAEGNIVNTFYFRGDEGIEPPGTVPDFPASIVVGASTYTLSSARNYFIPTLSAATLTSIGVNFPLNDLRVMNDGDSIWIKAGWVCEARYNPPSQFQTAQYRLYYRNAYAIRMHLDDELTFEAHRYGPEGFISETDPRGTEAFAGCKDFAEPHYSYSYDFLWKVVSDAYSYQIFGCPTVFPHADTSFVPYFENAIGAMAPTAYGAWRKVPSLPAITQVGFIDLENKVLYPDLEMDYYGGSYLGTRILNRNECVILSNTDVFVIRYPMNQYYTNAYIEKYSRRAGSADQTRFNGYTRTTVTPLSVPDGGFTKPGDNELYEMGAEWCVDHLMELRAAIVSLAPYFYVEGVQITFAQLFNLAVGTGTTWSRTYEQMIGTLMDANDLDECYKCVAYMEGLLE